MGLDLRLLPVEHDGGRWGFSHSILSCQNGGWIHDLVKDMRTIDPPNDFMSFTGDLKNGERGYGQTKETPYGEPVECLRVSQLLTIKDSDVIQKNLQNRAVWAYLAELPPQMKIAMYWH